MQLRLLLLFIIAFSYNLRAQFGPSIMVTEAITKPEHVVLADIDGDSDLDLLVGTVKNSSNNDLYLMLNLDGEGNYSPPSYLFNGSIFSLDDMDNDGDLDVIASGRIQWNDGNGNFPTFTHLTGASGYEFRTIDLDNDTRPDILTAEGEYLINLDGEGTMSEAIHFATEPIEGWWYLNAFETGDIDSDGDQDILFTRYHSSIQVDSVRLSWAENLGEGLFAPEVTLHQQAGLHSYSFNNMLVMDFDGDEDQDLIIGDGAAQRLYLFLNESGPTSLNNPIVLDDQVNYPTQLMQADINNDGHADIAAALINERPIWYLNDGNNNYIRSGQLDLAMNGNRSIDLGDINGDGYLDMASVSFISSTQSQVVWSPNILNNPRIIGNVFWDVNENGFFDDDEYRLDQAVSLSNSFIYGGNASTGYFEFLVGQGSYSLSCTPNNNWEATTPLVQDILLSNTGEVAEVNFGLKRSSTAVTQINATITTGPTRCNSNVPIWLSIKNEGNKIVNPSISFEIAEQASFIEAQPTPDEINGNTLIWHIENLIPTHQQQINISIQTPGVDAIGDTLSFEANCSINSTLHSSTNHHSELTCAYDPNDKLVIPASDSDENTTPYGSLLNYTVRFQNTGNDYAQIVRIEDQLDEQLDWNSFRVIDASHSYTYSLSDQGELLFTFPNIALPDSATNLAASNGFIRYSIAHKENLPEYSTIRNTANIFFDSNPAIVTNTTENTLVYGISNGNEVDIANKIIIAPNPTDGWISIQFDQQFSANDLKIDLLDSTGKNCFSTTPNLEDANIDLFIGHLPSGIYWMRIRWNNQVEYQKIIKN